MAEIKSSQKSAEVIKADKNKTDKLTVTTGAEKKAKTLLKDKTLTKKIAEEKLKGNIERTERVALMKLLSEKKLK